MPSSNAMDDVHFRAMARIPGIRAALVAQFADLTAGMNVTKADALFDEMALIEYHDEQSRVNGRR
jgi:hypothetical protein